MTKIKVKKIKLGIVGGGSGSWIGHVHRIAARFDDQYEIVSGVFSRNTKNSSKFGQSLGIDKDRCYSDYKKMANLEAKREDGIDVVAIMTPPGSHQIIAETFINEKYKYYFR
jgi:predicted dehydrogenase